MPYPATGWRRGAYRGALCSLKENNMKKFQNQSIDLPCPGCGRTLEVSYYELYTRRKPTCKRCRSYYEITSSNASKLRSEVSKVERIFDKLEEILKDIKNDSDKMIK